jgi:hypothetical protein
MFWNAVSYVCTPLALEHFSRFSSHFLFISVHIIFLSQLVNMATSWPADDVHRYVIPQKLLDSIFNKLLVFMRQWEKEKALLYPAEVPPP